MSRDTQQIARNATSGRESGGVQSVERAAALLRAVAVATGPRATATALAEAVGLNRTTTWRILSTLEQERLVSLDRSTGWYSLGFGLADLAGQAGDSSLVRAAHVVLRRIAAQSGETAALGILREGTLTYVADAVAESIADPDASDDWRDLPVPLHATSTGKVLLAFSGPDQVRQLLTLLRGGRLQRFTAATITSRSALGEELVRTRERGFAVCRGEFEDSAWGVSAPVLDDAGHPTAIVSIWGPPERITAARFDELGALAVAGAAELAGR